MGVLAVSWAFRQRISGNEKVVLLAIADHADDDGKCWPSVPLIAEKACVSERTVQRILANLEADNLVRRIARSDKDGRKTANLYVLAMDNDHGDKVSPYTDSGDSSVTEDGDSSVTEDGDNCVTSLKRTIIKNHQKEPSNILEGSDLEAEFAEFWAAYPKRPGNSRKDALKAYGKARQKLKVSQETILAGTKAYAAFREGEPPLYTKTAAAWLNAEMWACDWTRSEPASVTKADKPDVQSASDADLDKLADAFPGHIGERSAAKKHLADELSKGATLDALCEAARKYTLYCKGHPYEGHKIPPAMLETWLKFKWREMDGYEFCTVGPDRIRTVRPKKVAA